MSKVVKRLVCHQLITFAEQHNLLPNLQSAYRCNHSAEMALLKVVSDILLAAGNGDVTLLGLLGMSAAFDTIDHDIPIYRLRNAFGIDGTVLSWIKSFIHERTQVVVVAGNESSKSTVYCGVPQGSLLGPILFILYKADVTMIAHKHGIDNTRMPSFI